MQFLQKVKDFRELVMFEHSIFSMPFIFIAMVTAAQGWFGVKLLIFGMIASVSARNFAMAFNRFADRKFDATNPRTKNRPSVDGRISKGAMLLFIFVNASIFVAMGYVINPLCFYLSFPILIILASYSLMKRFSSAAHLVLGLSLGLAPIAGVAAVSGEIPLWSVYLCIGVLFWVAGFDLLYALQDINHDKKEGLYSVPSVFGVQKTLWISRIFHALTLIFWALFIKEAGLGMWMWIGLVVAVVALSVEQYLVSKNFEHIPRAFFTINGYLGIAFLGFCIVDFMSR
ncbi:menaquinone biosynthesis prenyltransferase MqnP [Helicobacter winghamensis]|uniref:4-hydroxybenzoate polyprenyltransferase n=1 Tax=Helicobacter winghamensis TaxID=157268 RepID=A0A2N3PLM4_9HELI|nr:menaquinone biosynthesis prenyltransferase MqnP [Helicobacter winghamensis]PKT75249.1 4-hydroxybenzoate polyprenyltransferase [Helicobacter winghamensis]PKT82745.1 4-hydroxybenzoate polyprenyltransferase [Helicobacter winghamensis]PKT82880.1 4-hydroxybenzoate polyprenyltransferase [Helicobacter winghamensis]QOQ97629.1 4-hydroxybenzoate polyprenyltransferase [Helicobacter winghamensis]